MFVATLLANVLFAMAQFLLARQVPLGFFVGRVLVPSLILNTLLAAPVYLLVRWWLRGAGDLRVAEARLATPARRDRPIRTGRRDRPIIQLPSVALRVAVIVGIAVVLFGIIFFRLWFLQILSGAGVRRRRPTTTACARSRSCAPRGPSSIATARSSSRTGRAWPSASAPWTCRDGELDGARSSAWRGVLQHVGSRDPHELRSRTGASRR